MNSSDCTQLPGSLWTAQVHPPLLEKWHHDPCSFELTVLDGGEADTMLSTGESQGFSFFEILYVSSGDGFFQIDAEVFPIKAHTVFILAPGQVRYYRALGELRGYAIRFTSQFLFIQNVSQTAAPWFDQYCYGMGGACLEPDQELQLELEEVMRAMKKEFANYFLLRREILSGLLNILLIHISRMMQTETRLFTRNKELSLIHRFRELVKQHFTTKKQVVHYARELYVTPNYLNKTVKRITGQTASHHIQQQIILEAKRRLLLTNDSMKEIAYFLGFDCLAHFSKFFKSHSGTSFSVYRKGLSSP